MILLPLRTRDVSQISAWLAGLMKETGNMVAKAYFFITTLWGEPTQIRFFCYDVVLLRRGKFFRWLFSCNWNQNSWGALPSWWFITPSPLNFGQFELIADSDSAPSKTSRKVMAILTWLPHRPTPLKNGSLLKINFFNVSDDFGQKKLGYKNFWFFFTPFHIIADIALIFSPSWYNWI